MKKFLINIQVKLENILYNVRHYFEVKKCKKLYPDYEDNDRNIGSLKHIWGVTSWDDLTGQDANLYTMNDIDITYDRESKLYMLGIETAYIFNENIKEGECEYLKELLSAFTKFMNDNGYATDFAKYLFMSSPPAISTSAESIEELYINFKIFVEGYCKVYGH